jgi:hypothetical protein
LQNFKWQVRIQIEKSQIEFEEDYFIKMCRKNKKADMERIGHFDLESKPREVGIIN